MAVAKAIIVKALEEKLRELYPNRSVHQIRPLARLAERFMAAGGCADFAIGNTLARYEITDAAEINRFKELMLAARREVSRLGVRIAKNQITENDFVLIC